jgi:hypothetical protein
MDLAQQRVGNRQAIVEHPRAALAVLIGGLVVAAVVVAMIVLRSVPAAASSTPYLGSPEWLAFRAGERASAPEADPFLGQSFLDFRKSERAENTAP